MDANERDVRSHAKKVRSKMLRSDFYMVQFYPCDMLPFDLLVRPLFYGQMDLMDEGRQIKMKERRFERGEREREMMEQVTRERDVRRQDNR